MEKRAWFASGKEVKPGSRLKYAFIALPALLFAGLGAAFLVFGVGDVVKAVLVALICTAIVIVLELMIWFVYKAFLMKK